MYIACIGNINKVDCEGQTGNSPAMMEVTATMIGSGVDLDSS